MTLIPEYAGARTPNPKSYLYRAAVGCGLVPLVVGLGILTLYSLTGWEPFVRLGLLALFFGFLAVMTGFGCLAAHVDNARRTGTVNSPVLRGQRWRASLLLAANFPVALFCVVVGASLAMRVVVPVTITNPSSLSVDQVILRTPDGPEDLGSIPPGGSASRKVDASGGGSLRYDLVLDGRPYRGTIRTWGDSDAALGDSNSGITLTVTTDPEGRAHIRER